MRRELFILAILAVLGMAFASSMMLTTLQNAMSQLCLSLKSMLPVVAMLMLVMAGVIYASGQILGAETRARANVWATACLTGALISILIVVIAQPVLQTILAEGGTISCTGQ